MPLWVPSILHFLSVTTILLSGILDMCDLDIPEVFKDVPYFGFMYRARQVSSIRISPMRQLLTMELNLFLKKKYGQRRVFNLLEIGSWAGESAVLWTDKMQELGVRGKVTCIDQWKPYNEMSGMAGPLEEDKIFRLFLRNIGKAQSGY